MVQTQHNPDQLLTEAEAAALVGFTPRALQSWRAAKRGPAYVCISARAIRYRTADILAWIAAHRRDDTAPAGR